MTLGRQLFIGITAVSIALLIGIEAIYVSITREHLERELDAHANETATSLAMTIGARMGSFDPSLVNTLVNPVFDRGHFESIEVRSPNGEQAFVRRLERREVETPRWFVALVRFEDPKGQSLITAGWRQLGNVIVRVHPQYAYLQLWNAAVATLVWVGILFAIALLATRFYLGGILWPLRRIEQTAIAISNREFSSIDIEPRTRELRRVTQAINSMSSKIRETIMQESDRAEQLRKEAFEDLVTGQLNRRGFDLSVSSSLGDSGEVYPGSLALFSVAGLEEINRLFGHECGNAILRRLANTLVEPRLKGSATVGRWQGPTLAAFLPDTEHPVALAWAQGVCGTLPDRLHADELPNSIVVSCGMAQFSSGNTGLRKIARTAESALVQAGARGTATVVALQTDSRASWIDLNQEVEDAIASNHVSLLSQNVISVIDQGILQAELFANLTGSEGSTIAAATFVPVARQRGTLPALDCNVVEQAIAAMDRVSSLPRVISVNISMQSLANPEFRRTLRELFKKKEQNAQRLVFEITGYAAGRSPSLIEEFAGELRKLGGQVAIDNFELDRNSITIVHRLLPAYVKLAPALTQQIGARKDLRAIVGALLHITRPLEILLIAQGVEDTHTIPVLSNLGITAYQGYAGGRPERLLY